MGIDKVLKQALGRPPRPGLVPQSGDPMHPDRWVRPSEGSPATRGAKAVRYEERAETPLVGGDWNPRGIGRFEKGDIIQFRPAGSAKDMPKAYEIIGMRGKQVMVQDVQGARQSISALTPVHRIAGSWREAQDLALKQVSHRASVQKDSLVKQVKSPWAVAAAAAKRMGYKDFSEGSAGQEKRDEIAEALKKPRKMDKQVSASVGFPAGKGYTSSDVTTKQNLQKLRFTTKRGKVESSSVPQHRLLHGRELPHTHVEGGGYKRETFGKANVEKHYTGAKHEHLESGQWVRPGMKTVPGKTWGGKVLAKEEDTVEKGLAGKTIIGPLKWPKPTIKVKRGRGLSFLGKGGVGSGRKPSAKGTLARMSAVKPAIRQYQQLRTPAAHQQVVEAFRQHEQKKEPLEELTHPWDKMYKAVVEKLGVSSGS